MQLVTISDTHGLNFADESRYAGADCLIHAGDFSYVGTLGELHEFLEWFKAIDVPHKILVAGNHDFALVHDRGEALRAIADAGVVYLEDSGCEIDGVKFWGSPWTLRYGDWAFMDEDPQLYPIFQQIPLDTAVLITHGPPQGKLDNVARSFKSFSTGSRTLYNRVKEVSPKLHIFGHIHPNHGVIEGNPTTYVNASICDDALRPAFSPICLSL